MNYHIVRTNEKLDSIVNLYNITKIELIELNRHITNWDNLIPGTRIKLPAIPDALNDELNDTEPFIEDYYPKIDVSKYESKDINVEHKYEENVEENESNNIVSEENIENLKSSSFTNSIKLPPNYSYYYNPYEYYRYYKRRNINKK